MIKRQAWGTLRAKARALSDHATDSEQLAEVVSRELRSPKDRSDRPKPQEERPAACCHLVKPVKDVGILFLVDCPRILLSALNGAGHHQYRSRERKYRRKPFP